MRLRLLRTLARGPHTTGELAHTPGSCCRQRSPVIWPFYGRARLLTARRQGRYSLNLPALTGLGTDVLAAILR